MTPEEIDKQLLLWKSRIAAASNGLAELSALPSYEIAEKLALEGETKTRIGPAVQAIKEVWRDYDTLSKTVQRASGLRSQISAFSFSRQSWNEIEAMLTGPCVSAREPNTLASRQLLTANPVDNNITLNQLLDSINGTFQKVRDGILELDASWKAINSKINSAVHFLDQHRSETAAGIPELRQSVEALRPRALHDPLGANHEFDNRLASALQRSQSEMAKLATQRKNLQADLAAARNLLHTVTDCRRQTEQSYQDCQQKIAGRFAELPLPVQRLMDWDHLIVTLEQERSGARLDETCEKLAHLTTELRQALTNEQKALSANGALLELRRELRGRLTALKAKASARGRVEDQELVRIADRANTLLYTRPTPIDEAATLVTQYQTLLNQQEIKHS